MNPIMNDFEQFSTRKSFNKNLKHFKTVSSLIDDIEDNYNLADVINLSEDSSLIESNQALPILNALIIQKYSYLYKSFNLVDSIDDPSVLADSFKEWTAVDVLGLYHHPELGPTIFNPKDAKQLAKIGSLKKFELLAFYVGFGPKNEAKIEDKKALKALDTALNRIESILAGKKSKTPAVLIEPKLKLKNLKKETPKPQAAPRRKATRRKAVSSTEVSARRTSAAPGPAPAAPKGNEKMVGPYSVVVSNELFHNGNVEAWKRIIESYTTKYPTNRVIVFYDGERIHDINTLFKWGKVKHGSAILFSVAGDNIQNVAKLKKYLTQGASSRFEVFLNSPVGKVLNLF